MNICLWERGQSSLLLSSRVVAGLIFCACVHARVCDRLVAVGESVYVTVKPGIMKAEFYEGIKEYLVPLFAVLVFH